MRLRTGLAIIITACLAVLVLPSRATDTLPAQLTDAAYWKMISDFSEPDGYYQYQVITSNEILYQYVLPQLTKSIAPGGAYLGVGPEQNFTYVAALSPKIAFIVDIRRDMMLEHLMYKAVFEMSADRNEFVSNLFSIPKPSQLTGEVSVQSIFEAYGSAKGDAALAEAHSIQILARLKTTHQFALSADDEKRICSLYLLFTQAGVRTFYSSLESPGYTRLMTASDAEGRNWSFLASKDNYDRVRVMHEKNLSVPLVGDFGGPKALRMAGQYLRDHGAIVNVFYLSNVEDYIQPVWEGYARNIASLPADSSSLFIRWSIGAGPPWLASINNFVKTGNFR